MSGFKIHSPYKPGGDQPQAIEKLVQSIKDGNRHQTLLGVTGSGKTFSAANVIQAIQKPTLVIAHNKTLAAQLAQEYREFFPENTVHYFVSYYDYYQPEAYKPATDTYIEKESQINAEIERLRHASTQALLTRKDVIIVASVSCIYGLGSPEEYEKVNLKLTVGMNIGRNELMKKLITIHFERTVADLDSGMFRVIGEIVEIMPVNEQVIYRIAFESGVITSIHKLDHVTKELKGEQQTLFIFPAKHFITDPEEKEKVFASIQAELKDRLEVLLKAGKILEAERLKRRTTYDLALIKEIGYCSGIENYSRHFSGKLPGEPPDTLLSYFPKKPDGSPDFLTIIDESHVTIPQIRGMYAGDQSRKETLVEHGFRLPSAKDNRPLKFEEFSERIGQILYTSATPGPYELKESKIIAEQVIRPTGLIDPELEVRPCAGTTTFRGQVFDFIDEAVKTIEGGGRVIATTLTKKMAEDLTEFLKEKKMKAEYIHSDVETIDRIRILSDVRRGTFDCLIGVNLLREGIDLPEVELIGILDADKEGFLRSETALIQIIGRAARNVKGRVLLYADKLTDSMKRAIDETNRRREKQITYNTKHSITPQTIRKEIKDITDQLATDHEKAVGDLLKIDKAAFDENPEAVLADKRRQLEDAVAELDFESAALIRDEIFALEDMLKKSAKKAKKPTKKKSV